jgi:hypothetical protein
VLQLRLPKNKWVSSKPFREVVKKCPGQEHRDIGYRIKQR